jgi:iron(III) transport system ATP-binding protein
LVKPLRGLAAESAVTPDAAFLTAKEEPGVGQLASQRNAGLEVIGLCKDYAARSGAQRVVRDLSFRIDSGHFYSLLGPSGCGKTTTLRCVAGLEHSDGGEIRLAGTVLSGPGKHVPPERRDLAMVFQNYAIWPHLTVYENAAFPLRVARPRIPRADITRRVEEALSLVQLSELAGRPAAAMSGGQQQRLALARALIRRPRLLLLDEPLSNLDAKLRDAMRGELRDLQRRLGITTLYVTHVQTEAMSMSDRVAVMRDGQLIQEGTPQEIYHQPGTRFVADFVGRANLVDGTVTARLADGDILVRALGSVLRIPSDSAGPGDSVTLSLRPEGIRAHPARPDAPNALAGVITGIEFLGEITECQVRVGETTLSVRQGPLAPVHVGDHVFLEIAPQSCVVLRDDPSIRPAAG